MLIRDLISISAAPAVISLAELARLRDAPPTDPQAAEESQALLAGYSLDDGETRAAFQAILTSLTRPENRGDAFLLQGVYGSGKSHLLAALALLAGDPDRAWPAFLQTHPEYEAASAGFPQPRLVVPIPLDEYPSPSHPLEHIVLSRIESELARRHGLRVALTEESHLLDLVDRYVLPQLGEELDAAAAAAHGSSWRALRTDRPAPAAQLALDLLHHTAFPLDWRRSRAEAWAQLRLTLHSHAIDGPLLLLDELGAFLAAKDRPTLNADASFLQYLAQRTAADRSCLVSVTQRGLDEVGDIDRRTLRQLRDRFRPAFTLDLSQLDWIVEHRLVRKLDPTAFREAIARLHSTHSQALGDLPFSSHDLARCYPINPLCLHALQRAAETCLSRTRSVVRLLQEALPDRAWSDLPAHRLITPDAAFDLCRGDLALSPTGQRHLHTCQIVTATAPRIAPGRAEPLTALIKALCLLGLGDLRWPERRLRAAFVGSAVPELWQDPHLLRGLLQALHRRAICVERARGDEEGSDEYYLDLSSDASEHIRQRLAELLADLTLTDSRVARPALEACRDPAFPLAALAEPRTLPVIWLNARRHVTVLCRDLSELTHADLQNLAAGLEAPHVREDARLFLALPTAPIADQQTAWLAASRDVRGRFAPALLAWLPRALTEPERDHLLEHAALSAMVADRTFLRRRDRDLRDKLRARWSDSEAELKRTLHRAYYEGRVLGPDGRDVIEPERLSSLFGDWDETLAAILSTPFRSLFPRFPSIAPARRLAGRAQTNQIIDHFIRPGAADLPPASTLEANLMAYAAPLGLVTGRQRHPRLALKHQDLLRAALSAAPPRSTADEIKPDEAIPYRELAGRLAKSDWGLTQDMSELLLAAMIRTGHLVPLDAFLQPSRLDAIAAPLGDNLPYLMRGQPLRGQAAEAAQLLWRAALGDRPAAWDLPLQEQAWDELLAWAAPLRNPSEDHRASLDQAAEALRHDRSAWSFADQAVALAAALAHALDPSLTSRQGLDRLVRAAARLPGGIPASAHALATWRQCRHFLAEWRGQLADLRTLLSDGRLRLPEASLLARDHAALLDHLASPERLLADPAAAATTARRWLDRYRRHYLAWHARAHAPAAFNDLSTLSQSAKMESARRLARAGLATEHVAALEADLRRALAARCLAGDPLPAGAVVCPICGLPLGEDLPLPDTDDLAERLADASQRQLSQLQHHRTMLDRRLSGCRDHGLKQLLEKLLPAADHGPLEPIGQLLTEPAIAWLYEQIARPLARRRELTALADTLRGKELSRRDVLRIVEEWLGPGDDEVVEIV